MKEFYVLIQLLMVLTGTLYVFFDDNKNNNIIGNLWLISSIFYGVITP